MWYLYVATTDGATHSYDDLTADPNTTYYYSVTAVNAVGESEPCVDTEVAPVPTNDPCTLPGVLLLTDAAGDQHTDGSMDILATYVAEPDTGGQPNKLVWTMKVADLSIIPPNHQWYIIWTPPGGGLRKYVAAKSGAVDPNTGQVTMTYDYGEVGSSSVGDPNINTPMPQGAADAGSVDQAKGTFTITIANSKVGSPATGDTLLTISPRTFAGTGNQNVITTSADDLTTLTPSYTLFGNGFCRPQTPPVAALSATVHGSNPPTLEGHTPLLVDFDASSSSDADAGDAPLTYTFDFGDGSNVVTQQSPTTSHTYNAAGTYRARLTAKDARGMVNNNIAQAFITATAGPTAAASSISGQVKTEDGAPLSGTTVTLAGGKRLIRAITDEMGNYRIEGLETGEFYTVTPARANYIFGPENRAFSLTTDKTDASFTARAATANANPLDSPEFFVRQQYVGFLGREPEQAGLDYWASEIRSCVEDADCINSRRLGVSAAFYIEQEFQQTGSFVYRIYKGSLGRQPSYQEFTSDRKDVVGGANLETSKESFADRWVERASFLQEYPLNMTSEQYVDKLLKTSALTDPAMRQHLIEEMASGTTRAQVLREVIDAKEFTAREYNLSFVLMQYFGYLKRDPDEGGYQFWLNVLNNREPNNYRGMVCSFVTSAEYQKRFSTVVTHSNGECK